MKPRALSLAAAALAIIIPLWVMWRVNTNRQTTTSSIVLTEGELSLDLGDRNRSALHLSLLVSGWPDASLAGRAQELGLTVEGQDKDPEHKPRRGFAVLELRHDSSPPPSTAPVGLPPRRPKGSPTSAGRDTGDQVSRLTPVDAGLDPQRLRQQWPQADRYLIAPARLSAHQVTGSRPSDSYWQMDISLINGRIQVPAEWRGFFLSLPKADVGVKPSAFRAHIRFGANYEPWLESAWLPPEPVSNPDRPPLSQQKAQ